MSTVADAAKAKSKFGLIEIGRGVASALVVLHHSGNIMAQPRFYAAEPFAEHLRNFNVGVDFFFVLSGFIITWIHWEDIGRQDQLGSYARKRFLRIYPPYWGVLFPLILLYLIVPHAGVPSQRDPLNILLSLFLLPYTQQPVLGVAWTLTHEIFFYLVFALMIYMGRRSLIILPIWGLAILGAAFFGDLPYPVSFFLSPFNIEFIMGVATAIMLKHWRMPIPVALATAGAVAFALLMLFAVHIQDNSIVGRLAFGGASMLFVLGAVEIERRRAIKLPRVLLFFGASSYAVYLVHPVALSFGVEIVSRVVSKALPLDMVALLLFAIGVSAGCLYHIFIEPNLVAVARKALSGRRRDEKVVQS